MASSDSPPLEEELVSEESSLPIRNKYEEGWRRIVRNFSPSWFAVTMGTGIVSVLLYSIPYHGDWLFYLSLVFFALNLIIFTLCFLISLARYTFYPEIWGVMIRDPKNSLFLACAPMGFATLLEMALVGVPGWGDGFLTFIWGLWIVDAICAVASTLSLCFILMSAPRTIHLGEITAAQLLPAAAVIVASSAGSKIAAVLPDPQRALATIIACYVLWGMGAPLAVVILAMYYQRLAVHKLPSKEALVSCFLPLGPLGFGGYGMMNLGKVCLTVFPQTHSFPGYTEQAATIFYVDGFMVAVAMWGFGLIWLAFAVATIYICRPLPFNMGWWGFTFPLGVYAVSTIQIGMELPSALFRVLGTVFAVCVIILWVVVAANTIRGGINGDLLVAPCLADLRPEHVAKGRVVVEKERRDTRKESRVSKGSGSDVVKGEEGEDERMERGAVDETVERRRVADQEKGEAGFTDV